MCCHSGEVWLLVLTEHKKSSLKIEYDVGLLGPWSDRTWTRQISWGWGGGGGFGFFLLALVPVLSQYYSQRPSLSRDQLVYVLAYHVPNFWGFASAGESRSTGYNTRSTMREIFGIQTKCMESLSSVILLDILNSCPPCLGKDITFFFLPEDAVIKGPSRRSGASINNNDACCPENLASFLNLRCALCGWNMHKWNLWVPAMCNHGSASLTGQKKWGEIGIDPEW